jgi:anti-anti-sigma regulatory factor
MTNTRTILSVPCASSSAVRRALRKDLLNALRVSESPVILDLTGRRTLDHDDIDLLLECVAQAAGRDTQLFLVAGSHVIRVLLAITRISSLVPVFNSLEEALAYPRFAAQNIVDIRATQFPQSWSA